MPSVSKAQNRLWHWVLGHPAAAKKRGISPTVAQDFLKADHGRHFKVDRVKPRTAADAAKDR
jgi:hypothetical protein